MNNLCKLVILILFSVTSSVSNAAVFPRPINGYFLSAYYAFDHIVLPSPVATCSPASFARYINAGVYFYNFVSSPPTPGTGDSYGTCAIAEASMVNATKSSGSKLCKCDLPQARAMTCASMVITDK